MIVKLFRNKTTYTRIRGTFHQPVLALGPLSSLDGSKSRGFGRKAGFDVDT